MAQLLYIKASPRARRSHSLAVADAFVAAYRDSHPDDEIVILDLFTADIPSIDGFAVEAKYKVLHHAPQTEQERDAWKRIVEVIADFKSANKYAIAVPMWNFSIPYQLKHYIDVIVQPGLTFKYSPEEGYEGLVRDKSVFIAYARGGEYLPGTPGEEFDYQRRYFETVLEFIGFTDIRSVAVEPTLDHGPVVAHAREEVAIERARKMALGF
ncbi:MAG: NAD(P)H-dependent oxidoreductase [bacterium]